MLIPKPRIIQVTWRDSHRYMYQMDEDELKQCASTEIITVGFLLGEREDCMIISQDYFDNSDVRGVIVIPRENIIKTTSL